MNSEECGVKLPPRVNCQVSDSSRCGNAALETETFELCTDDRGALTCGLLKPFTVAHPDVSVSIPD
jgi:hypothetical protein